MDLASNGAEYSGDLKGDKALGVVMEREIKNLKF
jgi:hypothetical protein